MGSRYVSLVGRSGSVLHVKRRASKFQRPTNLRCSHRYRLQHRLRPQVRSHLPYPRTASNKWQDRYEQCP
ncbi:hypothetical protein AX14_000625 [Amanita brunnescens Koide BX004]|nr:hypothetical protein AX14_000625 [Amanita brunnescens Koide BX004]